MVKRILLGVLALIVLSLVLSLRFDLPRTEVEARYTNASSRFLTLPSGARVHVRDEGLRQGPVLVLVHGSNDSLHTWEPWVRELSRDFRIVSLDLPAHGLTGRVPDDDYSNAAFVRTLHAVVERLQLPRFALAGNSMGGNIAWQYSLAHGDRVEKLVLLDASGYPDGRLRPFFQRVLSLPGTRMLFRNLNPRPLIENGLREAVEDDRVVGDVDFERLESFVRLEGSRDALQLRRDLGFEATPHARLPTLKVPTLILWGELDRFVPVAHAHRFAADIPGSKLIVYPKIGHLPMREIPERTAADARAFLLGT